MNRFIIFLMLLMLKFFVGAQDNILNNGLDLKYEVQLPKGNPTNPPLIILLHGRGADETAMYQVRDSIPSNYIVVVARAPYHVSANHYQWFDGDIVNGQLVPNQKQLDSTRALVAKFIDEIAAAYKANKQQVYLIGFSQGARMCYEVGLTAPNKLKGMAILSGRMFEPLKKLIKPSPELKKLKIFIGHGADDDWIKAADAREAFNYLQGIGLKPELHVYPGLHHEMGKEEISDLLSWLKSCAR